MSQYKSKISHKPNIFYGNYTERLEDWQAIRNIVNEVDNPIDIIVNIFQHCPRTKTNTDIYKKDTWLTGWQLIERNEYDIFDISLLVCYTVLLTDNFNDKDVKIHTVYKKGRETAVEAVSPTFLHSFILYLFKATVIPNFSSGTLFLS